jgi:hypothetical protein
MDLQTTESAVREFFADILQPDVMLEIVTGATGWQRVQLGADAGGRLARLGLEWRSRTILETHA